MGIKNFQKFIKYYCPEAIGYIPRYTLVDKRVGIDGNFWIYQIMASLRSSNVQYYNNNGQDITHIYGLYLRINSILRMNIKPVFVFDGKPPCIKMATIRERRIKKQNAHERFLNHNFSTLAERKKLVQNSFRINGEMIEDCKSLLNLMNIPYIQSVEEADSQLAWLSKEKFIEYIISNDFDIAVFGGNNLLPYFKSKNNNFMVVDIEKVKSKLNLTQEDLVKISIVLGNDYTKSIYTGDMKDLIKNMENLDLDNANNKKIIDYYLNPRVDRYQKIYYPEANSIIDIKKFVI